MDIMKIREARLASPFKPFRLIMQNGNNLPVERASYLAIAPNGRRLAYAATMGGFEFLAVEDVVEVIIDENLKTPWRQAR
ncbi:MAG TPA: hypothetical protein VHS31_02420 [Tepidisphaeraceae bacterium]|jgi:hypothetical protein|nr:hypothetical protein [Tepidisphaeraceae bacterium]